MEISSISRRKLLKTAGYAGLSGMTGALNPVFAETQPAGGRDASRQIFMRVSQTLTGRQTLNAELALALHAALGELVPGYEPALGKLDAALASQAGQDQPPVFSADEKDAQALRLAILDGWYLGTVGKGPKARCLAYVDALSNQVVSDVLTPPSYSYGPCGSWQAQP